ncbi:MAG TPA: hypothetical protein VGG17_01890, partial [Acidimicrobiales bacterium]
CADTAKYMIAPVTAEIALSTIPAKPIIIPLFACVENQNDNPVVAVSSRKFYDRGIRRENKITSTHDVRVARIQNLRSYGSLLIATVPAPYANVEVGAPALPPELCDVSKNRSASE